MARRAWRLRFETLLKSTIGTQRNSVFSLLPQSYTSRISRLVFVKNHHKPGNKWLGLSLCSETWAALGMTRTDPCNYFSSTSSSTSSTFSDSIAATPEEDADVLAFDLSLTTDAVGLGFGLLAYFLQPSPRHSQSRLEIKQAWSNMVCTRQAKKKKTQTLIQERMAPDPCNSLVQHLESTGLLSDDIPYDHPASILQFHQPPK